MVQRTSKSQLRCLQTNAAANRRLSTFNRLSPTVESSISPNNASRTTNRQYKLTNDDLEFIKLYSEHFPRAEHSIRPPQRSKRRRKAEGDLCKPIEGLQKNSGASMSSGQVARPKGLEEGHTFELAEELRRLKERPLASGVQGQMRLLGGLRKLDQDRECAWKSWMQCAMRKEARNIDSLRLPDTPTRATNLQDVGPPWYQQLSWEQMETVNKLEMTLYEDIDEGTTFKTRKLLRDLGIVPPPGHRIVKDIMNSTGDNPCKFLVELYKVISRTGSLPKENDEDNVSEGQEDEDEDEDEGGGGGGGGRRRRNKKNSKYSTGLEYTLDERLLMSALAHLRLADVLDKLDEEYGKPNTRLPYFKIVIPPSRKRRRKSVPCNTWPYLQPLHIPEYNWLEPKMIEDAIYAQNLYMTLHRIPPPLPPQLRPVPFTHIEIPEDLKPRRYEAKKGGKINETQSNTGSNGSSAKTAMNPNCRKVETSETKNYRVRKNALVEDTASMDFHAKMMGRRSPRWRNHLGRRRLKPRFNFFASWLGGLRRCLKSSTLEEPRPSSIAALHGVRSSPRKNKKDSCESDCKEISRRTGLKVADTSEATFDSDSRKSIQEDDVLACLAKVEDEPLMQLSNPVQLPPIQKWIRMKNGLNYIHPVVASELPNADWMILLLTMSNPHGGYIIPCWLWHIQCNGHVYLMMSFPIAVKLGRKSKKLWSLLEGGKCSSIPPPELCLTPREEKRLNWDHHTWLRCEVNRIVNEFYRTCFEMQIALTRESYPAMATDYIASRDKLLKTYFTYLPAKPQDCFRKPWKKSEYNTEIYPRWRKRYEEANQLQSSK